MADGDSGAEGGGHVPGFGIWPSVPHYYGDYMRQLMLGGAVLMLIAAPFYGDLIRVELPFEVVGALVLVALAALTNPWKKSVITADAVVTGVWMSVYQVWALYGYENASALQFVLREALSILFLVAFYFSVKTMRAMILHQIGKRDTIDEFEAAERRQSLLSYFRKPGKDKMTFIDKTGD